MALIISIITLIILIFLSAFFAGAETAFVSLSNIRLNHLIEKKKKGAALVKELKDNYPRMIITLLVGNNLVNIAASSIATAVAIDLLDSAGVGIAIGIMTFIILIFGEITPKSLALSKNEFIAFKSAPIVRFLMFVLFPIIIILEKVTYFLSRTKDSKRPAITEEEIKSVVNLGEQVGEVEEDEKEMIHNIFAFSDTKVAKVMTPRTKIFSLNIEDSINDNLDKILATGKSRIPIFDKTHKLIVGVLYVKDLLKYNSKKNLKIKEIMRDIHFVPENMLLDDLLRLFQKNKEHLAIVLDELGSVIGIITIEDVLEEIVGEIYDETDIVENNIKKLDEKHLLVKGEVKVSELNKLYHLGIKSNSAYETLSGVILEEFGRIPKNKETILINDNQITIESIKDHSIDEVKIKIK